MEIQVTYLGVSLRGHTVQVHRLRVEPLSRRELGRERAHCARLLAAAASSE